MAKWNVSLSCCVDAKGADEAVGRLMELFDVVTKEGNNPKDNLKTDESFDFSVSVSEYGD